MTTLLCRHYCADYGKCVHVIFAFEAYKKKHGENCPLENLAFSEQQCPPCLVSRGEPKSFTGNR